MHARRIRTKQPRSWYRRWTKPALVTVLAGISGAALTQAAIKNRGVATASPAVILPKLPAAPLLSPAEVEAGLVTRLERMQARRFAPALEGARSAVVVAAVPTPQPLPRDLVLPPTAPRQAPTR